MPIDFLMSVHLATMMPDLAYDMSTSFDTKVELLLHNSENGSAVAAYKNDSGDFKTYADFESESGFTINMFGGTLGLNKEEAKTIMEKCGIKSQSEGKYACTGNQDLTVTMWAEDEEKTEKYCEENEKDTVPSGEAFEQGESVQNVIYNQHIVEMKEQNCSFPSWKDAIDYYDAIKNGTYQVKVREYNTNNEMIVNKSDIEVKDVPEFGTPGVSKYPYVGDKRIIYVDPSKVIVNGKEYTKSTADAAIKIDRLEKIIKNIHTAWKFLDDNYEKSYDTEKYSSSKFDLDSKSLVDIMKECFDDGGIYGDEGFSMPAIQDMVAKENNKNTIEGRVELGRWYKKDNTKIVDDDANKLNENENVYKDSNDVIKTYIDDGGEQEITLELSVVKTDGDNNVDLVVVAYRDMTNEEIDEKGLKKDSNLCSDNFGNIKKVCSKCAKYVRAIFRYLAKANENDFDTFIPYISKVENHWFRDVYFVINTDSDKDIGFITYDDEYEATMNERWTLYETYTDDPDDGDLYNPDKKGDFVYYKMNEDGSTGERYTGNIITGEEVKKDSEGKVVKDENGKDVIIRNSTRGEDGSVLVKKAVTIDLNSDTLKDYGWNSSDSWWNKNNKIWTAYEAKQDQAPGEYEPVYPGAEDPIRQNIYVSLTHGNNIIQTGEGLRTVTNNEIKKMFLTNTYFRYDGSEETAEIITALRKKNNIEYGSLDTSADYFNKETEVEIERAGKKEKNNYKVSDYSGQVSLNQDALNAFSMLENTHTLDADYLYKDFKELVVELGYFTKEELTDETPKLLQFPIPEIGSFGFPIRALDKRENEFGTMLHSEGDYKANEKNTLKALIENAREIGEPQTPPEIVEKDEKESITRENINRNKIINSQEIDILGQVATLNNTPIEKLRTVGAIKDISPSKYTYTATGNNKQHTKIGDLEFNGVDYECWFQTDVTCTLYSFAFVASAYTNTTFENYVVETTPYWCPGLSWSAFDSAGVNGKFYGIYEDIPSSIEDQGNLIAEALDEGKPVYFYSGFKSTDGVHAVVLLGANDSGKILYYNPWGGTVEEYGSFSEFHLNLEELLNKGVSSGKNKPGKLESFFIPDEPPVGVKRSGTSNPYQGFSGNEAVVSPVTGILLEYGTYTDEDKDPVTDEQYRVNVDLKYGTQNNIKSEEDKENENAESNTTENSEDKTEETGKIVSDKVGYAKILVLDTENYLKLQAGTENSWKEGNGLVKDSGGYLEKLEKEDEIENLSKNDLDKTVYGYKEFVENYEKFGIAGYVLYIDGFKCELPGGSSEETAENPESSTTATELTLESFKGITKDSFDSDGKLVAGSEEKQIESKYERDPIYKTASEKANEKLNAEGSIKEQAISTICVDDLIFIKEGTVLGRTYKDKEIEELRGETYVEKSETTNPEETTADTDNSDAKDESDLVGNYLRIIMRDLDDTVVENVEDYMKMDESDGYMEKLEDEKFLYWMGVYLESGILEQNGDKWVSKSKTSSGDAGGATHYFGLAQSGAHWTTANKLGYTEVNESNWKEDQDFEMILDIYLHLIDEQKAQVKKDLQDENMSDGYLQAFMSILHNYGNVKNNKRGREYIQRKGSVTEQTWTTYEDPNSKYAPGLTKRRIGEWILITKGKYMDSYGGNTKEIDFTDGGKYSEETPFSDFCKEHGVSNIKLKKVDE